MSDDETVKIRGNINIPTEGVNYSEDLDTNLTPEEWVALTDDARDTHAELIVQNWFESLVQYGWSETAGEA